MRADRLLRAVPLLLAALACGRGGDRVEAPALLVESAGASQRPAEPPSDPVTSSRRTAIVDATRRVGPAVVSLSVVSTQRVSRRSPFDFFFLPEDTEQRVEGSGTGFVWKAEGLVITNQHVVAGARQITVTFADGSEAEGEVVGEDPTTDIAVVRVTKRGLPVAPLGTSQDLLIGEWVVALGNPYAYLLGNAEPTVTVGVVSATGRNIVPSQDRPGLYLDMIQTDAAINPGNSGGPLANARGEIVGVNSSIFTSSGGSIGLGFAIPIERAVRVAEAIVSSGSVRRAWTGLEVEGPNAMRDWRRTGGLTVTSVVPGGPAARAGIRRGDVLTEANGRRLRNFLDWEAVKLDLRVGDIVDIRVREGSAVQARRLATGDVPSVTAEKVTVLQGLQLTTVTPAIRAERGLRTQGGALIYRVSDEVAAATGLRTGDVILAINNQEVRDAGQVADVLNSLRRRQAFRVYFERERQVIFTDLAF